MARTPHTSEQIRYFATAFSELADIIDRCVSDVAAAEEQGFDSGIWLHADSIKNTRLPEIQDWVDAVDKEVRRTLRAFKQGLPDRAQ